MTVTAGDVYRAKEDIEVCCDEPGERTLSIPAGNMVTVLSADYIQSDIANVVLEVSGKICRCIYSPYWWRAQWARVSPLELLAREA